MTPDKVVVITHNRWVRHVVLTGLAHPSYRVVTASNGVSGLRVVERELPQLILLEMALPELSGTAVIDEVRRLELLEPPRIIVLTADAKASDPACGRDVDGVLIAPFTPAEVVGRVEWIRANRRSAEPTQAQPAILSTRQARSVTHLLGAP